MVSILSLDVAGNPFRWLTPERAAYYQAANKVAWEIGEKVLVLRGGVNRHTGERSILEVAPVIALAKSEGMAKWAQVALPLGHRNDLLFARDRHICAYCGERIERGRGTRDHVMPRARGGLDTWENTVTACRLSRPKHLLLRRVSECSAGVARPPKRRTTSNHYQYWSLVRGGCP